MNLSQTHLRKLVSSRTFYPSSVLSGNFKGPETKPERAVCALVLGIGEGVWVQM